MHQADHLAFRPLRFLVDVAAQIVFQFRRIIAVKPFTARAFPQIFRQPLFRLCRPVFHDVILLGPTLFGTWFPTGNLCFC